MRRIPWSLRIVLRKDPEEAIVVSWLNSVCCLVGQQAKQNPTEEVHQDLHTFISWLIEELLQHPHALGLLPAIVEPINALEKDHPAIFGKKTVWSVVQAMVVQGVASMQELPKSHLCHHKQFKQLKSLQAALSNYKQPTQNQSRSKQVRDIPSNDIPGNAKQCIPSNPKLFQVIESCKNSK